MHRLFVYGTLREGERLFPYIAAHVSRVERATLAGAELRAPEHAGFPYLFPGAGTVTGDLLTVDEATLRETDRIEGNGFHYDRRRVTVTTDAGAVEAWTYYALRVKPDGLHVIESGDWKRRARPWEAERSLEAGAYTEEEEERAWRAAEAADIEALRAERAERFPDDDFDAEDE